MDETRAKKISWQRKTSQTQGTQSRHIEKLDSGNMEQTEKGTWQLHLEKRGVKAMLQLHFHKLPKRSTEGIRRKRQPQIRKSSGTKLQQFEEETGQNHWMQQVQVDLIHRTQSIQHGKPNSNKTHPLSLHMWIIWATHEERKQRALQVKKREISNLPNQRRHNAENRKWNQLVKDGYKS